MSSVVDKADLNFVDITLDAPSEDAPYSNNPLQGPLVLQNRFVATICRATGHKIAALHSYTNSGGEQPFPTWWTLKSAA